MEALKNPVKTSVWFESKKQEAFDRMHECTSLKAVCFPCYQIAFVAEQEAPRFYPEKYETLDATEKKLKPFRARIQEATKRAENKDELQLQRYRLAVYRINVVCRLIPCGTEHMGHVDTFLVGVEAEVALGDWE